jgi:hypothetical protein
MGCLPSDDPNCAPDEQPAHQVHVNAFQIDVTEVTEADINDCYDAGACNSHFLKVLPGMPASGISWKEAKLYCAYRGGRLPGHTAAVCQRARCPLVTVRKRERTGRRKLPQSPAHASMMLFGF